MDPTKQKFHPSYQSPSDFDIEDQVEQPKKRVLKTNGSYVEEWRYGSKARVVKYYVVHFLIGVLIGGIIGVVIGVCVRYVGK